MEYTYYGCTLTINGKQIEFSRPIGEVICWNDIAIVRLESIGKIDDKNNLIAIKNGKFLWQLQDYGQFQPRYLENQEFHPGSITRVQRCDDAPQLLLINTGFGFRFTINPQNGLYVQLIDWVK